MAWTYLDTFIYYYISEDFSNPEVRIIIFISQIESLGEVTALSSDHLINAESEFELGFS